jgi:hypothetical protein
MRHTNRRKKTPQYLLNGGIHSTIVQRIMYSNDRKSVSSVEVKKTEVRKSNR